jgi:hypothetical protein
MTRHRHADVLIAIAEGREVEFKTNAISTEEWIVATPDVSITNPITHSHLYWRVKPVPVIRYEWLLKRINEPAYAVWHEEVAHWDIKITFEDNVAIKVESK